GQARFEAAQTKPEVVGELHRALDRAGVARESGSHFGAAAQVRTTGCRQPAVEIVEASACPYRGEGCGEPVALGGRIVHVARRDDGESLCCSELGEGVVACVVEGVGVTRELDSDVVSAEE